MANGNEVHVDVRAWPHGERRPKIFGMLDALRVGQTLVILNDHEPVPLRDLLQQQRPGQFEYSAEQKSPEEWVACFRRVA